MIPNSGRSIESEVANRFLRDNAFTRCDINVDLHAIPSSLHEFVSTANDDFPHYPQTFWMLSLLSVEPEATQLEVDRGEVDNWPLELKSACKLNVRVVPTLLHEISAFFESLHGSSLNYIRPRINKYGRCEINGIKFSSEFNSIDCGSVVKAMFVDVDKNLSPYFGIVKFYFTVTAIINQCPVIRKLALAEIQRS